MRVTELFEGLPVEGDRVPPSLSVARVRCDSRQVKPGDLFVAVAGAREDGRRYARDAVRRGAVLVVSEAPRPEVDAPVLLVPDARAVLAQLACRICGHPSARLLTVGITGTNGKTTTAALLAAALRAAGRNVGLLSTVQIEIAGRVIPAARTTPDAPGLQQYLMEMVSHACDAAVLEISSHALDQRRVDGTRFNAAIFTNLSRDHLDYHRTMEAYFEAKWRLFERIATEPEGVAIVNADDPWGQELIRRLQGSPCRVLGYGLTHGALRAEATVLDCGGSRFTLQWPDGRQSFRSRLPGRYNIYNLMAAALAADALGVRRDRLSEALQAFAPQWGRLERVDAGNAAQPAVFVDYAHTDDALSNVLQTLREITRGQVIVVFGCGGDRDPGKRLVMGQAAARGADRLVITSDNPRSEDPDTIIADIVVGLPADADYRICPDRREAIALALRMASPGDSVLIAGKGHETYQELAHTVVPFDDRATVRTLLGIAEART